MAIDPLQLRPAPFPLETATAKRKGTGSSAFDALLESVGKGGAASGTATRQAALELMRMEMMQSSLALSGDGESPPPSGVRALQSLFCAAAGIDGAAGSTAAHGRAAEPAPAVANGMAAPGEIGVKADQIGKTAAEFLGTPYRFGGEGANGIDCSSFVQQVFREHEIALPRTAREQIRVGSDVAQGDLKKGDLVFFHTYASYPSHVGIYLGEGKMIHASSAKGEVTVSDMNSDYYRSRFIGAKRIA